MGMYTAGFVAVDFKKELEGDDLEMLKWMFVKVEEGGWQEHWANPPTSPDHPLFEKRNWKSIGCKGSYYHPGTGATGFYLDTIAHYYKLTSYFDIKNYDSEIGAFFDWIAPLTNASNGEMLGFGRYEEDEAPSIIYRFDESVAIVKATGVTVEGVV